ncbi:mucoidy inhibitor MuiA family protein [Dokdonia sp. Asnod2-E02]|uniref:DUF4139 domain-containing protein n=1 Tax=Dokdonia sp. Asnod2-E02 TaxID=3160574 RepID=UPI003870BE69
MKKLTLLASLLLLVNYAFAKAYSNPLRPTPSKISKVTVYLSGAQVERSSQVTIAPGTTSILFDNLSNDVNENSIQISGLDNASILSINFGINYLTEKRNSAQIDSLNTLKTSLEVKILKLNSKMSGLSKEEEVISANQRLGGTSKELDISKVKELSTYYRTRVTEIKNAIVDAQLEKSKIQKHIRDIEKQFAELNVTEEKSKGQITLKLSSEETTTLNLILKYNVREAGWYPEYDIKATGTDAPLDVSYKAHLYQKTSEDWDNVQLVLSTGDPNTNNIKPTVDTKHLRFVNRSYRNNSTTTRAYNYKYNPNIKTISGIVTEDNGPLPGANVIVKGTSNGTQTDFDGKYTIQVNEGETLMFSFVGFSTTEIPIHASIINANLEADNQLDEVIVTAQGMKRKRSVLGYAVSEVKELFSSSSDDVKIRGYSSIPTATGDIKTEGITNTKFEINKPYSIDSDGDVTVIEIDSFMIPASYEYYVAPAINENVFLTASIKDWINYSLLPGEANVYFEGSFSGKTYLNPLETTEKLSISLGIDPNLIVKRKELDNFKSKSLIGSQRIINKEYEVVVKNNKSKPVTVKVVDRVPISQNKEIKVGKIVTGDALYDEDTGILEWTLTLSPASSNSKQFSYELKYPKYKKVNL